MQHTMDLQSLSINKKNNYSTKLHSLGGAFSPLTMRNNERGALLNNQMREGDATYTKDRVGVYPSLTEL